MPTRPRIASLSEPAIVSPQRSLGVPFIAPNKPAAIQQRGTNLTQGLASLVDGLNAFFADEIEQRKVEVDAATFNVANDPRFGEAVEEYAKKLNDVPVDERGNFAEGLLGFLKTKGIDFPNVLETLRASQLYGRRRGEEVGRELELVGSDRTLFDFENGKVATPAQLSAITEGSRTALRSDEFLSKNPLALQEALVSLDGYESRFYQAANRTQKAVEEQFIVTQRARILVDGDDATNSPGLADIAAMVEPGKRKAAIAQLNAGVVAQAAASGVDPAEFVANGILELTQNLAAQGKKQKAVDTAGLLLAEFPLKSNGLPVGMVQGGDAGRLITRTHDLLESLEGQEEVERDRSFQEFKASGKGPAFRGVREAIARGLDPVEHLASLPELQELKTRKDLSDDEYILALSELSNTSLLLDTQLDAATTRKLFDTAVDAFSRGDLIAFEAISGAVHDPDLQDKLSALSTSKVPELIRNSVSFQELEAVTSAVSKFTDTPAARSRSIEVLDRMTQLRRSLLENIDPTLPEPEQASQIQQIAERERIRMDNILAEARRESVETEDIKQQIATLRSQNRQTEADVLQAQNLGRFSAGEQDAAGNRATNYNNQYLARQQRLEVEANRFLEAIASTVFPGDEAADIKQQAALTEMQVRLGKAMPEIMRQLTDDQQMSLADIGKQGINIALEKAQAIAESVVPGATFGDVEGGLDRIQAELVTQERESFIAGVTGPVQYRQRSRQLADTLGGRETRTRGDVAEVQNVIDDVFAGTRPSSALFFGSVVPEVTTIANRLSLSAFDDVQALRADSALAAAGSYDLISLASGAHTAVVRIRPDEMATTLREAGIPAREAQTIMDAVRTEFDERGLFAGPVEPLDFGPIGAFSNLKITQNNFSSTTFTVTRELPDQDISQFHTLSDFDLNATLTPEAEALADSLRFPVSDGISRALVNAAALHGQEKLLARFGAEDLFDVRDSLRASQRANAIIND